MIKRIVSLFVVVCLLLSLFCVTASAADIYEIDKSVVLMSSAPLSVLDSGISTAAVEPSDLDEYLSAYYKSYNRSVAELLAIIAEYLDVSGSSTIQLGDAVYSIAQLFGDLNDSLLVGYTQSYLDRNGSINRAALGLGGFIVDGIMGLAVKIDNAVTSINAVLSDVVSGLSTVNTSVGTVNTSVNSFYSLFDSRTKVPSGNYILDHYGNKVQVTKDFYMPYILSNGFVGLRSYLSSVLVAPASSVTLGSDGNSYISGTSDNITSIMRKGFLGLSSNIKGSETDNIYTSTLNDNNNTTTTVNSTGLGPLLNTQLSNIGENLGHLAYIFASDDDIKLKQDSQPLLDETESFYDDSSDSKVKVSAGNIGSFKGFGSDMLDIVDTGADIGDVVTILSNDNSFRWFTAQTAIDLDSIGTATISDEESTYDRLHREFNEIYFPDRVGGGN